MAIFYMNVIIYKYCFDEFLSGYQLFHRKRGPVSVGNLNLKIAHLQCTIHDIVQVVSVC